MDRIPETERTQELRAHTYRMLEHWVDSALADIDLAIQGQFDRFDELIHLCATTINKITVDDDTQRLNDFESAVVSGRTNIDSEALPDEQKRDLHEWFAARFQETIIPAEERRIKEINAHKTSANEDIQRRNTTEQEAILARRTTHGERLASGVIRGISLDSVEQRICDTTSNINQLLARQELNLSKLILAKVDAHKSLTQSKRGALQRDLSLVLQQLESRIHRVKTSSRGGSRYQHTAGTEGNFTRPNNSRPQASERPDPRVRTLMGKATGLKQQPFVTVLGNIDHHRAKGKSDEEIFRLMVKSFHPDSSGRTGAEDVMKVLSVSYDRSRKAFIV